MKYPWLAMLWRRARQAGAPHYTKWAGCGATIVARNFVISAAHCLFKSQCNGNLCIVTQEFSELDLAVRVGDWKKDEVGETNYEEFVNIKKIHKHPGYEQRLHQQEINGAEYDIVILELDKMLPLDPFTPACLAKAGEDARFDGEEVTLAGWGRLLYKNKVTPNEPYEVNVKIAKTDTCPLSIEAPSRICVGQDHQKKGGCKVLVTFNYLPYFFFLIIIFAGG